MALARPAKWSARLSLSNAFRDEHYRLLVYGSRNGHTHAAFNAVIAVESTHIELAYAMGPDPPSTLHFILFANGPDKNSIMHQSCLAWGSAPWPCSTSISLVDVKGKTQAVLSILHASNMPSCTLPRNGLQESKTKSMLQHVKQVYGTLKYEINSYLSWVVTPSGKIPVLPYIMGLSSILSDPELDSKRAESFLQHLFNQSGDNLCLSHFQSSSESSKARWVSEIVTLMQRAMLYEQDVARIGGEEETIAADQWVRLLTFPEPNIAGFDCEDSAILCIELLYLLNHVSFQSSDLQAVQEFLRPYSACFIFGSIKTGGPGYSPHAFAALVDTHFLTQTGTHYLPSILLEGTARIGGAWNDGGTKLIEESFSAHSTLLETLGHGEGYSRTIRNEASLPFVKENKIYGPIAAIVAGDMDRSGNGIHFLTHLRGSSSIGVSMNEFFSCDKRVELVTALKTTQSTAMELCSQLPRSHIPFVIDSQKQLKNSIKGGLFHVDIHYETYKMRQEVIDQALEQFGSSYRITPIVVRITDQLKVMQLWFSRT